MKNLFQTGNILKSVLLFTIIMFAAAQSRGQQLKPADSGYAPVNGLKVYYEVYGR